ncbi:helix-turn-helix domain-containing protein [Streptomyces boncukensis]|uniref:Helix-turn-helix domain-containing protein n=1 Tax=Streptomyces boncukensis TaxID=2711219 RepID=A0A6G4X730_9ACTN|nr:helix-turn-helix transcriptional regulator [Streptomyces boncukensis]NGO73349.1 helix-turn-helix domain-containing protein [Streptomyces boncukensis]
MAQKSVYRRQLAARLRELREESDLTLTDVAEDVEVSPGALSRIENGDRGTSPVLVKALLDRYGTQDPAVREDVLDLVRADQAQKRPWWRKYAAVVNTTQYGGFLALESGASAIRSYEALWMPGLLQTEEYARSVIGELRTDLTSRQVDTLVKVRMQRQQLLEGDGAPKLWVVIDEAALRRRVGGESVMLGQLERLVQVCDHPQITVQLLPFDAGVHAGLYGAFVLMDFPQPTPQVVWVESLTNSVCFESSKDIDRYAETFDQLRALAVGPPETRRRFQEAIRELSQ